MKRYGRASLLVFLLSTLLVPDGIMLRASNEVTFRFTFPNAKKVKVFGSFNSWSKGYALKKAEAGGWKQTVELTRGRYEYKFLVDGKWRYDSTLPSIDDGLYSRNNVIIVR